jgi:hypothetical protein
MHRRNKAEQMIRHFKDHFLSILAGVDATFLPSLWDLLLPQAKLTINLLRQATANPKILAWEYHFAGLCKALALSKPEVVEFAGLCESFTILNDSDALAVLDHDTGKLLEHRQLSKDPHYKMVWDRSYANKLGHLCQGVGTGDKAGGKRVAGTNTFHLIAYADIPHQKQKQIIYTKVVCEVCEGKDDDNCTRITVGGNLICYPGNAGTNTASLKLIKLMLNSVISRKGARFACIDIKKILPRHANGRSRVHPY